MKKIKAGIFDGPQIRLLLKDPAFTSTMKKEELNAWKTFSDVVKTFWETSKPQISANLLKAYGKRFMTYAVT